MGEGPRAPAEDLAAFHRRYWAAWDAGDTEATAECVDPDFSGTFAGPLGAPVLQVDRDGILAMISASFAQTQGQRAGWRRSGVVVLHRAPNDATAAMRVECLFPDRPEWNNAELTVEAYRRGPDGRWRILRVHSERLR